MQCNSKAAVLSNVDLLNHLNVNGMLSNSRGERLGCQLICNAALHFRHAILSPSERRDSPYWAVMKSKKAGNTYIFSHFVLLKQCENTVKSIALRYSPEAPCSMNNYFDTSKEDKAWMIMPYSGQRQWIFLFSLDSRREGDGEIRFLVLCKYCLILQCQQDSAAEVCSSVLVRVFLFLAENIPMARVVVYGLLSNLISWALYMKYKTACRIQLPWLLTSTTITTKRAAIWAGEKPTVAGF